MADLSPNRPTSPHLSVYRLTWLMIASIMHRITGAGLYVGMGLLAWCLISLALGPNAFSYFQIFSHSLLGKLILFGYSWMLLHHMLGGIRYLIWDSGHMLEVHQARSLAIFNFAASFVFVLALWLTAGGALWQS